MPPSSALLMPMAAFEAPVDADGRPRATTLMPMERLPKAAEARG
jgi:hypothetical protein